MLHAPMRSGSSGRLREIRPFSGTKMVGFPCRPLAASVASAKNRKERPLWLFSGAEPSTSLSGNPIRAQPPPDNPRALRYFSRAKSLAPGRNVSPLRLACLNRIAGETLSRRHTLFETLLRFSQCLALIPVRLTPKPQSQQSRNHMLLITCKIDTTDSASDYRIIQPSTSRPCARTIL
jgi:hypothetical protein